jgi:hypothetical protein
MLLPFRAKISYMSGEYSDEWAELRRLRRRVLTVVFAGAAIFVLVPLVSTFALHAAANAIGLALFAAWVLVLFRFSWCLASTFTGHARDAASLSTTSHAGTADGTIRSLGTALTVVCQNGWTPILTQT